MIKYKTPFLILLLTISQFGCVSLQERLLRNQQYRDFKEDKETRTPKIEKKHKISKINSTTINSIKIDNESQISIEIVPFGLVLSYKKNLK